MKEELARAAVRLWGHKNGASVYILLAEIHILMCLPTSNPQTPTGKPRLELQGGFPATVSGAPLDVHGGSLEAQRPTSGQQEGQGLGGGCLFGLLDGKPLSKWV